MYLGIDCGTQGTKALLVDDIGRALGRGYAPHKLVERLSGAREQDPQWWVEAMIASVNQALLQVPGSVRPVHAIGVSGQQHGLVVLDQSMAVIRPAKLWNDTETAPQNAELVARFGGAEAWFERFGIVPRTGYTVSKLLWMKEVCPEDFERIHHILLPHEYLNWWMTGELCSEAGDASGTAFFDPRTRSWAEDVLAAIDGGTGKLLAALPKLIGSMESVGSLKEDAARELGLEAGCLVSSGGGDNMMGAIGTGNVREGIVTISLGTSSTVYSFSKSPVYDPTGNVAPYCSSSGGWLPLVCTMNSTNVINWILKLGNRTVDDIDAALAATPPGADGIVFIPFLNGERTPDLPDARGGLFGLSGDNYKPDFLIRAAIEGVSFGILNGLDRILGDRPPEEIQVIGGGSRSHGWRQLLADATGARVVLPAESESGCLGAAIQACVVWEAVRGLSRTFEGVADRMVTTAQKEIHLPNPNLRPGYDRARELYARHLKAMYPEAS